jgi:hypothetical protein
VESRNGEEEAAGACEAEGEENVSRCEKKDGEEAMIPSSPGLACAFVTYSQAEDRAELLEKRSSGERR